MGFINSLSNSQYGINYSDLDNTFVFKNIIVSFRLFIDNKQIKLNNYHYKNVSLRKAIYNATRKNVESIFDDFHFSYGYHYSVEISAYVDKVVERRIYIKTDDFKEYHKKQSYYKNRVDFVVK